MGPGVWYTKKFGTQPDKEVELRHGLFGSSQRTILMRQSKQSSSMMSLRTLTIVLAICTTAVKAQVVHNLLTNPSFEEDLRGTWFSYGFDMVQYAKDAIHMRYSVKCTNRKSQNHGPTQELQGLVTGGRYAFQAKVKLLNENATTVWQRFKATVAFQFSTQRKRKARSTDEEETGYIIAYRGFVTKEQGWVNLEGNINAPMKEFTGARLTIRGPDEGIDFLVDDAILWEVPEHPNWEAQARDNIERFRKSNIRFRVSLPPGVNPQDVDIQIDHKKHHFAFGSLFRDDVFHLNNKTAKEGYLKLFNYMFNWATIQSYKWKFDRGSSGSQPDFSRALEATDYLLQNGIKVRGHSILWGFAKNIPDWVLKVPTRNLPGVVAQHIRYMMSIAKGKLAHWDVQNEYIHGHYYEEMLHDPSVSMNAFKLARPLDPVPKLYLNDFQAVTTGASTEDYHDLAMRFIAAGTGIQGLGIQGHTKAYVKPDPTMMWKRIDRLAETGLELFMTEFDVAWEDDEERADWFEDAIRAFFAHPDLSGVILWDFWDLSMREPFKHLVSGEKLKIIEPGQRWACLVKKEWSTHVTKNLAQSGLTFDLRGFQGDYEVIVKKNGVPVQVETFSLGKYKQVVHIRVTNSDTPVPIPLEHDYVPQCISHRAQRSLGTQTAVTNVKTLSCRFAYSPLSGPFEHDEETVLCDADEVLTSCSSFHTSQSWKRNGEQIVVEDGVAKCKVYNGRDSVAGLRAMAVCCKVSGLTCDYRTAGPSSPMDGAQAEATCPSGYTPLGCSSYSRYPDLDGGYPDVERNSCLAQSGAPILNNPVERSGAIAFAACCKAPSLKCQVVTSEETGLQSGDGKSVTCPPHHEVTGCMAYANSSKAAGVKMFELNGEMTCRAILGADLPVGSSGLVAYATCCTTR